MSLTTVFGMGTGVPSVLGDVPLSNPEVVAFIGSFIRENTQEITAQAQ